MRCKNQLSISRAENERIIKENEKIKIQLICLEQENERVRRECYKLLEVEKFKAKKLEESLLEKCKCFDIQRSISIVLCIKFEPREMNLLPMQGRH